MKIWLLEDGERTGPFESFGIRERVSNGELGPDTPAWYDGADGWVTLAEVPSLISAFPRAEETTPDFIGEVERHQQAQDPQYKHELEVPEHVAHPPRLHPVQRLFARMIDVIIYLMVVMLVMAHNGVDLMVPDLTPTAVFCYHAPYVIVDALLMHLLGTTVGKFFLGIKVTTQEGGRLSLGQSILRSARVWVIGLGMFTIVMPVTFLFSWLISRRYGKFLWDLPKNIRVEAKPLQPLKVIAAVVVVWCVSMLIYMNLPEAQRVNIESVYQKEK